MLEETTVGVRQEGEEDRQKEITLLEEERGQKVWPIGRGITFGRQWEEVHIAVIVRLYYK